MITLKCKHCGASLEREPNVGLVDARSGDEGGTYDFCPDNPTAIEERRKHVAQKLMQVQISGWVSVDADAWTLAYGTERDEIPQDVRDYALEQMRAMVTDELMVRDVMVKGS